jgi:hypothetical protein
MRLRADKGANRHVSQEVSSRFSLGTVTEGRKNCTKMCDGETWKSRTSRFMYFDTAEWVYQLGINHLDNDLSTYVLIN